MAEGFHIPESPLGAVGYTAAFSADQVIRSLGSEYDYLPIVETSLEAASNIQHHSEAVYKIVVTVERVED